MAYLWWGLWLFCIVLCVYLNVSLLSSVIPSSLTSLLSLIVSPQASMGRRDHCLFHVNMTIFVLTALMLSPLEWHQFSNGIMIPSFVNRFDLSSPVLVIKKKLRDVILLTITLDSALQLGVGCRKSGE